MSKLKANDKQLYFDFGLYCIESNIEIIANLKAVKKNVLIKGSKRPQFKRSVNSEYLFSVEYTSHLSLDSDDEDEVVVPKSIAIIPTYSASSSSLLFTFPELSPLISVYQSEPGALTSISLGCASKIQCWNNDILPDMNFRGTVIKKSTSQSEVLFTDLLVRKTNKMTITTSTLPQEPFEMFEEVVPSKRTTRTDIKLHCLYRSSLKKDSLVFELLSDDEDEGYDVCFEVELNLVLFPDETVLTDESDESDSDSEDEEYGDTYWVDIDEDSEDDEEGDDSDCMVKFKQKNARTPLYIESINIKGVKRELGDNEDTEDDVAVKDLLGLIDNLFICTV